MRATTDESVAQSMDRGYGQFYVVLSASLTDAASFLRETAHALDVRSWDGLSESVEMVQHHAAKLADDMKLLSKDAAAVLEGVRTFLPRGSADETFEQRRLGELEREDPILVRMLDRERRFNWLRCLAAIGLYVG